MQAVLRSSNRYVMESRYEFLRTIACAYKLSQAQTKVFLTRFAYGNMEEKNQAIAESLKLEPATVQSHMRVIYQKFAENPYGCTDLNRSRGGRGQFGKLFSWLWEEKFSEWLAKQQSDDNGSLPPPKLSLI